MSRQKTFKEQKEQKETHDLWKANREGKRPPKEKGGHRNLVAEAEEEALAELYTAMGELVQEFGEGDE